MKLKLLFFGGCVLFFGMKIHAQQYTGIFKTETGNTDYHHFTRDNAGGAAVYINQVGEGPILRLSNGIVTANKNVVFTVENDGNTGIGTTSPSEKLHISSGSDGDAILLLEADKDNSNEADNPLIQLRQDGDIVGVNMGFSENFGENVFGIGTRYANTYGEKWDTFVINTANGNIGIGTITPDAKLTVKGKIHTQEVKVDLAGAVAPDYVFKKDYHLRSLEEVQAHINEKGHLPGIPSAEEMETEGMNLKEMNLKLLEKVEELTLYVIELKKENTEQNKINRELKSKIISLEEATFSNKK